jgi:SAM-dependent methyltransferase
MKPPRTTEPATNAELKERVRAFWNHQTCDTDQARSEKFSREYFDEIERWRYHDQPFIHNFAQFTRYHGKRVLEVGVGAGTDFIQWLRAGAVASGIDLTEVAIEHVRHRIEVYGLPQPESLGVADAENLPFESDTFDLGYSFGVLHHSPDTGRAIAELVRVVRPGGELKIMLYNRRSIWAFNLWVKHALLRGRPWRTFAWALWNHMESVGTKAYSRKELMRLFQRLTLAQIEIQTETTGMDCQVHAPGLRAVNPPLRLAARISNKRLGFFHCIAATKAAVSDSSVS